MDIWLFENRLTLSAKYRPIGERPKLALWTNGGRQADECLDITSYLWRFEFGFTLWNIGSFSIILRRIPSRRLKRLLND